MIEMNENKTFNYAINIANDCIKYYKNVIKKIKMIKRKKLFDQYLKTIPSKF